MMVSDGLDEFIKNVSRHDATMQHSDEGEDDTSHTIGVYLHTLVTFNRDSRPCIIQ